MLSFLRETECVWSVGCKFCSQYLVCFYGQDVFVKVWLNVSVNVSVSLLRFMASCFVGSSGNVQVEPIQFMLFFMNTYRLNKKETKLYKLLQQQTWFCSSEITVVPIKIYVYVHLFQLQHLVCICVVPFCFSHCGFS